MLFSLCFFYYLQAADQPFWLAKPHVYSRIENGEIIVSAKLQKKDKIKHLRVISAGQLKAPYLFAWQEIMKFENYSKISEHFKNISHNKKDNTFYMEVGAFSYFAKLWISYKEEKKPGKKKYLSWQVVKGGFKGMSGHFQILGKKALLSEVSMQADMQADLIPIPNALIKIGLEFVGKLIAQKMRKYLEKTYQTTDIYE